MEFSGIDGARVLLELGGEDADMAVGLSPSIFVTPGGSDGVEGGADTAAGPSVSVLAGFGGSDGNSPHSAILDLMGLEIRSADGVPEVSEVTGTESLGPSVDPLASAETEVAIVSVDQPEEAMHPVLFTTTAMDNGIVTFNPTHTTFGAQDFSSSTVSSRSTVGSVRALTDSSGQSSYFGVSTTAVSSTPLVGPTAARMELSESFDPLLRPTVPLPVGRVQVNFSVVSEVGLPGGPSPVSSQGTTPPPDRILQDSTDVTDKVASRPVKKVRARQPRVGPSTGSPLRTRSGMVRGETEAPGGRLVIIGLSNESAGPGIGSESDVGGGVEDLLA